MLLSILNLKKKIEKKKNNTITPTTTIPFSMGIKTVPEVQPRPLGWVCNLDSPPPACPPGPAPHVWGHSCASLYGPWASLYGGTGGGTDGGFSGYLHIFGRSSLVCGGCSAQDFHSCRAGVGHHNTCWVVAGTGHGCCVVDYFYPGCHNCLTGASHLEIWPQREGE